jgi:hypothetical protein
MNVRRDQPFAVRWWFDPGNQNPSTAGWATVEGRYAGMSPQILNYF